MNKLKLLWVGDAAVPTGFARATHEILDRLCQDYDVTVLGINYRGDPHPYSYPIYTAYTGGDGFGVGRLIWMCDKVKPAVIVFQNDGWNIPAYIQQLQRYDEYKDIPVIATVAVDGKNFRGKWLDGVAHAIFWTEFGLREARYGGFQGAASVIPLGVDLATYYPEDKKASRNALFGERLPDDIFIVGNVNRNQPRKRWDLTLKYFAEWVHSRQVPNAYLYLHAAPTGDTGVQIGQLAEYYGILERTLLHEPAVWYGMSEDGVRNTYNSFDVQITTTQGEGFGLTTLEGLACGIPSIVPNWSSLGETFKDATVQVECTSTAVGPPYINVIGGIADEQDFVDALDALYTHQEWRDLYRRFGMMRAHEPRFSWNHISERYFEVLDKVLHQPISEEVWRDLGRPEEATA
jgi:D-inositol-3-phosphate glycosyltransferase